MIINAMANGEKYLHVIRILKLANLNLVYLVFNFEVFTFIIIFDRFTHKNIMHAGSVKAEK